MQIFNCCRRHLMKNFNSAICLHAAAAAAALPNAAPHNGECSLAQPLLQRDLQAVESCGEVDEPDCIHRRAQSNMAPTRRRLRTSSARWRPLRRSWRRWRSKRSKLTLPLLTTVAPASARARQAQLLRILLALASKKASTFWRVFSCRAPFEGGERRAPKGHTTAKMIIDSNRREARRTFSSSSVT